MNSKLKQAALALVVVMLVVSMVTTPMLGSIAPGMSSSHDGTAAADDDEFCESNVRWALHIMSGGVSAAYCVVSGLLDDPSDASNSAELEEAAYVQHGSIAESYADMEGDYHQHRSDWKTLAFADGEQKLIEARYHDETERFAVGDARSAVTDAYSYQHRGIYRGHNEIWEEAYLWGQATADDDEAQTIIYAELEGGSTEYRIEFGNSRLVYGNVTLPNGEQKEVVTRVNDVNVDGPSPDGAERADLRIIDPDGGEEVAIVWFDGEDNVLDEYVGDWLRIVGDDPNGGTDVVRVGSDSSPGSTTGRMDSHTTRWINALEDDRADALELVEQRADEVWTEIAPGEVHPSEYYGPREFYNDYGSAMDTSVAAQLYFHQSVGYNTVDPTVTMVVNDGGETYQGGVIVESAEKAPLVYDDDPLPLSKNGDVSLTSHQHQGVLDFGDDNKTSVTFTDGSDYSTDNIDIDVINVDNVSVSVDGDNITATFSEQDMQDESFVIFRTEADDGESVEESGIYVLFADENTEEIRGFVTGEEYNHDFSMLYLTGSGDVADRKLGHGWVLEENYDGDGNEKAVAVTHEGVDMSFTGTTVKDRIEKQQTIQDAVDNNDNIVEGGGGSVVDDGPLGLAWYETLVGGLIAVMILLLAVAVVTD